MTAVAFAGAEKLALLLALSLFFGFAFEDFYTGVTPRPPGGVRTFPLLALAGGGLYLIEPHYAAAFLAGVLVVGSWIYADFRAQLRLAGAPLQDAFIAPVCNLLAFVLGPLCLTQPLWLCVAVAVVAVILLGSRRRLHDLAARVPAPEIITAGQFLLLVGVVLPLLPGLPVIPFTSITPFDVWLAVVAVSSISYGSYLLQRLTGARGGTLWSAILGGLYSSTATTVVLARRAAGEGMTPEFAAGIVAATTLMYVRVWVVTAIFNFALARLLAVPLLVLTAIGTLFAVELARRKTGATQTGTFANPLQLSTAFVFAILLVVVSMLATFAEQHFGRAGVLTLAGIVGFTDIDPFVLTLAQNGAAGIGLPTAATAILIAASSNNVLKAIYAVVFSRRRESAVPAAMLAALAVIGVLLAFLVFR